MRGMSRTRMGPKRLDLFLINLSAHNNVYYVKFNGKVIINQYLKYRTSPFLPQTSLW